MVNFIGTIYILYYKTKHMQWHIPVFVIWNYKVEQSLEINYRHGGIWYIIKPDQRV